MKKIITIFCLILITTFIAFFPCIKVVSISNRKNLAENIYSLKALNGFSISYTHSVNKGRIHDFYVCDNNQFILEKSIFVSYGAGIPEPEEITDCDFEVLDNGFVLNNINRNLDYFLLAVGVIAEHSITTEDNEYFLKDFFPEKTSLVFKIKKISLLQHFINGGFDEKKSK